MRAPESHFWSRLGDLHYADSADHYENGLARLMHLTTDEMHRWVDFAGEADGSLLQRLATGWARLQRPSYGLSVALSADQTFGWLQRPDGTRETLPPPYDENYFEGPSGYGDYGAQASWRLEKSARQVADMQRVTGLSSGRVLDVGSGYGFLRVALKAAGFLNWGIEASAHARRVQWETHGFQSMEGWSGSPDYFHVITAFDFIEHLPNPAEFFFEADETLKPGGYLGIRTPNLDCPEREVFGSDWHSLKREHLVYFTPESLTAEARDAGFEPVEVATTSHLLSGFVGESQCAEWAMSGRGDNIEAWYRKVG